MLVRLTLVACLLACSLVAAPVRAQQRPTHFYVLTRAAPPDLSADLLPADAREHYLRTRELRSRMAGLRRAEAGHAPSDRMRRLASLEVQAWAQLEVTLARRAAQLTAAGWLIYAEARFRAEVDRFVEAVERADSAAVISGEVTPDYQHVIRIYRHVAATGSPMLASWARYFEGYCLLEHQRWRAAADAFRLVAAGPVGALRGEASLRLGEDAFDDHRLDEAAGWYGAVDSDSHWRTVSVYKRTWALWLLGEPEAARLCRAALPDDAERDLVDELDSLLARPASDAP